MSISTDGSKLKVFVSYSRDDLNFADQLAAGLELCGFDATLDRHEITGGEAWQARLGGLIRDADTVAFVLSPSSAQSKICAWEVAEATKLAKRILPVVARPIGETTAPEALQNLNYVFFYDEPKAPGSGFGCGLTQLVAALNTDVDWVREHTRLLARASEWDKGGKIANRLLSGNDIIEAKAWAARRPLNAPELTGLHLDYIRTSEEEEVNRASAERQRLDEMAAAQGERAKALKAAEDAVLRAAEAQAARARAQWWITWGSAAFSVVLAGVAVFAVLQYREANRKEAEALASKGVAEANRREALVARSNTLASAAEDRGQSGDETTRLLLALEALPDPGTKSDIPFVRKAKAQLDGGLLGLREIAVFKGKAQFTPDEKQVVVGYGTRFQLADVATGQAIASMFDAPTAIFKMFSADGRNVVVETESGVELRNFETGAVVQKLNADKPPRWTSDKKYLFATAGQTVTVWDANSGSQTRSLTLPEGAHLQQLNADASRAIVLIGRAQRDQEPTTAITLFDTAQGREVAQLAQSENAPAVRYKFDGDGRYVVVDSGTNVRIFDAISGRERFIFTDAPDMQFSRVVFSPDGKRMFTVSGDKALRLWEPEKDEPLAVLTEHKQEFVTAIFSSDSSLLLTVSDDLATVRDGATGNVKSPVTGKNMQPGDVSKAAFSPDGRRLLLLSKSSSPGVFSTDSGKFLPLISEKSGPVPDASFSPDGRFVVTTSTGSNLRLWSISENRDDNGDDNSGTQFVIGGHSSRVNLILFSRDGQLLLTSSHDGTSRLWSLHKSQSEPQHAEDAAAKVDLDVLLRETDEKIVLARQRVPRCLDLDERIKYALPPRPPGWCFAAHKFPYNDPLWRGWPGEIATDATLADERARLGRQLGDAAGTAILDRDDHRALEMSDMALLLAPSETFIHINRAHALMYLGKTAEARAAYLAYRGADLPGFGKWESVLVKDFADLRLKRQDETPLMREVEQLFAADVAKDAASGDAKASPASTP